MIVELKQTRFNGCNANGTIAMKHTLNIYVYDTQLHTRIHLNSQGEGFFLTVRTISVVYIFLRFRSSILTAKKTNQCIIKHTHLEANSLNNDIDCDFVSKNP